MGCGNGRWMAEMNPLFPLTHFDGFDVANLALGSRSHMITFEINDANRPEGLRNDYEFVHVRRIASGIKRYSDLVQTAYDVLLPGGMACFIEDVGLESPNATMGDHTRLMEEANKRAGRIRDARWDIGDEISRIMVSQGWCNVRTQILDLSVGTSGGVDGERLANVLAYNYRYTLRGAVSRDEVDQMIRAAQREWRDPDRKVVLRIGVNWGYKDLPDEKPSLDNGLKDELD
ncbi:hypothetical protein BT69DRAFT_1347452 [Atractiella rhizophila]|nr:hypothetical protein BT69DRAFT_1347452 [Atractiella rhizophila]